jgi:DNA-binding CsgD family transcriptional regulator
MRPYHYLGYGLAMALLLFILKQVEYRYSIRELSTEVLVGIVAILFMGLGYWLSRQLDPAAGRPSVLTTKTTPSANEDLTTTLTQLGISEREYEILQLLAAGHSNQEIANQLFISLNTVKTHLSNLYLKLDVRRRTQAVQVGQQLGIL